MVKILLVANTDWYLYNFRLSLAKMLREEGFEVTLVSPGGSFVEGIRSEGFHWLEWSVGRQSMGLRGESRALWKLRLLYQREKPDLVHHFTVKPVLYGSLAARLGRGKAVVNSITGLGYLFLQQSARVRLVRWLVLGLYRQAFHQPSLGVIFENESDRDFFLGRRLLRPEQTQVIHGVGVDLAKFRPTPALDTIPLTRDADATPLVVLPARMLWDKGVGVMAEAARLLKQRRAVRVALVGASDPGNPARIPESTLQQWAAEGWVEWWGFNRDMPEVYRQAQVVALPSMGEGLPTALLEAAACERPIVATDVPGCREVVLDGETGLLVPPNDPAALAAAVERLLDDPALRRRLGKNARQRVAQNFSDQVINEQTLAVYRSLLG
jgi:glycosyltransferase involved in cell wall biosynthesis